MPDHDSSALSRQTKRRRVDIGVKRTVGSVVYAQRTRETILFNTMNQSHGPEQDRDCSLVPHSHGGSNGDGEKSNVLRKLLKRANSYEDAMMPYPGTTIISQLLKSNMGKNGDREGAFQGSGGLSSAGSDFQAEDVCSNSSRDRDSPLAPSPRLTDEHLRAKRARVENIIRGMSHSPCVTGRREDRERNCPPLENKRKQRLPQQQQQSFTQLVCVRQEKRQEERRQLKLQLEDMQKQLRQLQEKFYQIYETETEEEEEEEEEEERAGGGEDGNLSENSVRSDGLENTHRDRRDNRNRADGIYDDLSELVDDPGLFLDRARALLREQGEREGGRRLKRDWGQGERGAGGGPMRAEGRQLAETLKQELNSAMSQVVDTVVKGFNHKPPSHYQLQHHPSHHINMNMNGDSPNFHSANQRLPCFGDVIIPSTLDSFGGLSVPTAGDQTEALPLVVRKTSAEQHPQNPCLPPPPPPHPHHPSLHSSPLSASLGFSPPSFRHPFPLPLMGYPFQSFSKDQRSSPESMDLSRETVGLRTKMGSGGGVHFVSHHHHHRQSSPPQHGGGSEGLSLIKSECGDLQDMADISPYSGSTIQEGLSPNHLKKAKLMFFYSRYPSSNMLKTFFSDVKVRLTLQRHCKNTTDVMLSMSLSQVPERFLEVSQLTLREFFNAIVAGKDVDPSWKKAIYKVICKLDSEVPEVFKSPNCLQELLNE
uniref:Prospero domain-containing protein n=1 Tax=Oncorhynchus mykiss TaxID=8022 RepID=A0A8C7SJG5_ONCMY